MAFHPYLYFDGNCREAFTRYQEIFDGELMLMTGHEAPPGEAPEGKEDLVMHVTLLVDGAPLMASDSYDDDFAPANSTYVHYSTTDLDNAKKVFEALSEGGTVELPGGEVFWSPFFGVCVDRFGTNWQVSLEVPQEA
ncbi:MAG TPA: VOC family protein [Acidimicrobiales bacterium]|nr:VOC family protein [Acidimicrobiales bacterium]